MPLTLENTPGFADVPDSACGAYAPALADVINKINLNATLGMVRPEIFHGDYKHGETVLLPISDVDGYAYQRSELAYMWAIQSTVNPSTMWISGPDSLWCGVWNVDQTTGAVECIEYYRKSGDNDQAAMSNDGILRVFTIAQRQYRTLLLAKPASTWLDIPDADFSTDAPLDQAMAQALNRDAKLAVLNSEIINMGECWNGVTIPQPVSPADGYVYSYSQVKFAFSWRWTTLNSAFTLPDKSLGQLGPMQCSINPTTGAVTVVINYITDTMTPMASHGRVQVFAFCDRGNLIGTLSPTADDFAEIDPDVFMPGSVLKASVCLQLMKNIREAACSCEFFGPASYHNSNTIPLPVSPIDGYAYNRQECTIIWEWDDTTNQTGTHLRVVALWADVFAASGHVSLKNYRLPPGGPWEESDDYSTIHVVTVAQRGAQHSTVTPDPASPGAGTSTETTDQTQPENSPYALPYFAGQNRAPTASETILRHQVPGNFVSSMTLPQNLVGSYGGCLTAPTGSVTITVKRGATTLGTMAIAATATTMTFSWAADVTFSPGDIIDFIAPGTADATLKGVWFTLIGKRT